MSRIRQWFTKTDFILILFLFLAGIVLTLCVFLPQSGEGSVVEVHGSLTLVFYLHFPYHLYYSLLRLIFLSIFMILLVLFCAICVIIRLGLSFVFKSFYYAERKHLSCMLISPVAKTIKMYI